MTLEYNKFPLTSLMLYKNRLSFYHFNTANSNFVSRLISTVDQSTKFSALFKRKTPNPTFLLINWESQEIL